MIKNLILLLNVFFLLLFNYLTRDAVIITQEIPASAAPGSEFIVKLTINKGETGGFAKLQQELPPGFTATSIENSDASFTFSDQTVKFIWVSLPDDKEFEVSYKVKVSETATGNHTIAGSFAYLENNDKQTVNITPAPISINGSATAETPANTATSGPPQVNVTRTVDVSRLETDREVTVEITVSKGSITGFAKLQEDLPESFTATEISSSEGVFSFNDQKVKYLWMTLPSASGFKVAYKINIPQGLQGIYYLNGEFSYLENDETKKFVIKRSEIDLGGAVAEAKDTETATPPPAETTTTPAVTNIPQPQGGVNYRVQIAALRKFRNKKYFREIHRINEEIFTEMHEGWNKYTVGGFDEYKRARDRRENIREGHSIKGPFVTAYNNGRRITVQEALMITNQKWYK